MDAIAGISAPLGKQRQVKSCLSVLREQSWCSSFPLPIPNFGLTLKRNSMLPPDCAYQYDKRQGCGMERLVLCKLVPACSWEVDFTDRASERMHVALGS